MWNLESPCWCILGISHLSPCESALECWNLECNRILNSNSNSKDVEFGIVSLGMSHLSPCQSALECRNWERNRILNSNSNSKGLDFGIVFLGIPNLTPCQSALQLGIGNVTKIPIPTPIPIPGSWNLRSSWNITHHSWSALECWNWE